MLTMLCSRLFFRMKILQDPQSESSDEYIPEVRRTQFSIFIQLFFDLLMLKATGLHIVIDSLL